MKGIFGEKGFTLIEMLLVLTLIAAIVGVALPSFRSMQQEGHMTRAHGDLRTLQTAIESYRMHTGLYPPDDDDLSPLESASPAIVSTLPTDPFTDGDDYLYTLDDDNQYVIYSVGPDSDDAWEPTINDDGYVEDADNPEAVFVSNCSKAPPD